VAFAPARNWVVSRYDRVEHKISHLIHPSYTPVHATRITWSTATPPHPASNVADGYKNTFWSVRLPTQLPSVTFHFDKKVSLNKAIFYDGDGHNYQATDRADAIHVVYSNGHASDISLKDSVDPQTVSLSGAKDITSVTFEITSMYRSASATHLRLSEIELFHLNV
jgi:hypothetical protein